MQTRGRFKFWRGRAKSTRLDSIHLQRTPQLRILEPWKVSAAALWRWSMLLSLQHDVPSWASSKFTVHQWTQLNSDPRVLRRPG